jgi:hypothetical protein
MSVAAAFRNNLLAKSAARVRLCPMIVVDVRATEQLGKVAAMAS